MNKYLISLLVLSMVIFAGCGKSGTDVAKQNAPEGHKMTATEVNTVEGEKLIYYTCPMESHKHVHSHESGTCIECGMPLVAGVITSEDDMDYYGCPMLEHSHVRSDQPGTCADCGMKLKPMRLVKS